MKFCSKCQETKEYSEFYKQTNTKDGYHCWCKKCRSEYDSKKYDTKRKYPKITYNDKGERQCRSCSGWFKPQERNKNRTYCYECRSKMGLLNNLSKYKMTPEQYIGMYEAQNGLCAICQRPETKRKRLAVDHDHSCCPGVNTCGKCVRGLICQRCNMGMGAMDDNPEILLAAYRYLTS